MKPLTALPAIYKDAGLVLPEKNDIPTILRYGLGGAAVGGGTAAILSLIQKIKLDKKLSEERRRYANPETDENTIVLRLPAKRAAVSRITPEELKALARDRAKALTEDELEYLQYAGAELPQKQANDPATFAAASLAAMGGGVLSYQLIRKLHHKQVLKELAAREEAARTELLDNMLAKQSDEKQAGDFSGADSVMGSLLLLGLLGAGGSAYVTKKYLDQQFAEKDRAKYTPPKVNRVIIRTQPADEASLDAHEKVGSEEDMDVLRTISVMHMMKAGDDMRAFEDAEVKAALAAANLTKEAALELGTGTAMGDAISGLLGQEDIRRSLQRAYMQDHPMLKHFKWALRVPGLRGIADRMTYSKLGLQPKVAFMGNPGFTNSLLGSIMANEVTDRDNKDSGDKQETPATPAAGMTPQEMAEDVSVTAEDPGAAGAMKGARAKKLKQALIALIQPQGA